MCQCMTLCVIHNNYCVSVYVLYYDNNYAVKIQCSYVDVIILRIGTQISFNEFDASRPRKFLTTNYYIVMLLHVDSY